MAEPEDVEEKKATGKRGRGLLLAIPALAIGLAAGGFYATWSGLIDPRPAQQTPDEEAYTLSSERPEFVELDPLQVSVGGEGSIQQLRFRAYLQIGEEGSEAVEALRPRILDIFATYLRALPVETLQDPTALIRIRAQLLRRVQLLTGDGAVDDLLIIDFVVA
jgi:flagellar FliL protein